LLNAYSGNVFGITIGPIRFGNPLAIVIIQLKTHNGKFTFHIEVDMPIQIEIPDDFFSPDEREKLTALLRVSDDKSFAEVLNKVTLAALDEYRQMFLGMGLPSRANEIREYRLFYLIKRFFQQRIPDELEVASMFQLPITRSKNLILNVLTRFRYDLLEEINSTLRATIGEAEEIDDGRQYRVFIASTNMVDELNRIIARSGRRYRQLTRVRNEPNEYLIAPDSYEHLFRELGLN
jgi:hypothetical protein